MATKKTTKKKAGAMKIAVSQPEATKPRAKKGKATPAKKLSQMAAAVEVLGKAKEPMNCKELVEAMTKRGLWASPGGKTPEATLYASILRDLAKGTDSRFQKAAPGRFTLASRK